MKEYMIYYHYENISLIDSTLALLKKLNINTICGEKFEYYGEHLSYLLNERAFFIAQAYNIAKAKDKDLLVLEDDAFKSLTFAKKMIDENPNLFNMIEKELSKQNIKYSQDTNIIHISNLLSQDNNKIQIKKNLKSDFSDFSSCIFYSNNLNSTHTKEILDLINLKIHFESYCDFFNIPNINIAYKYSAKYLENAIDCGCDFIISNSIGNFNMFDRERKKLEKMINRDLSKIPVINLSQLLLLAFGINDDSMLNFRYHKFIPEFI
ncbi:hypothetical protein [Helicobacter sp. MIT 14-3879]|uniref:HdrB C-terminal domain-containing protein n=1 Tax=Helicobacter sp. MIT 14-3879 TaxID=2040649 RepID=UPI000E1EC57B|nr:hypothetical protein [Helicobacter sp. MIT 14-3879]RDU62626.1 hypothetical protein CQA44_06475 [Helicobacter sp. MIT 14-3879]